jgi:hypothetical protein
VRRIMDTTLLLQREALCIKNEFIVLGIILAGGWHPEHLTDSARGHLALVLNDRSSPFRKLVVWD